MLNNKLHVQNQNNYNKFLWTFTLFQSDFCVYMEEKSAMFCPIND